MSLLGAQSPQSTVEMAKPSLQAPEPSLSCLRGLSVAAHSPWIRRVKPQELGTPGQLQTSAWALLLCGGKDLAAVWEPLGARRAVGRKVVALHSQGATAWASRWNRRAPDIGSISQQ